MDIWETTNGSRSRSWNRNNGQCSHSRFCLFLVLLLRCLSFGLTSQILRQAESRSRSGQAEENKVYVTVLYMLFLQIVPVNELTYYWDISGGISSSAVISAGSFSILCFLSNAISKARVPGPREGEIMGVDRISGL